MSQEEEAVEQRLHSRRPDIGAVAAIAAFAYFVLVSGISWRDFLPAEGFISGVIAAVVVLVYLRLAPALADRFDRNMLIGLILFVTGSIFSLFPRQSFDSVLMVVLYVAALFIARGVLAREAGRRLFATCLIVVSALLTVTTAVQFILPFIEWWALTDWAVFPPLDLQVVAQPWGYRHDMAVMLVILYPSWWIGRRSRLRTGAALLMGALVAAVAFIDGSRTVWLAAAVAAAAIALPIVRRGFQWNRRLLAFVALGLAVAIIASVIAAGGAATLGERVFRIASITERGSVWGPLLAEWTAHPVVGVGPGSFPWLLQLTDYFDTNSFAPRHPDSAVVQLVVESGILGIAALLAILATAIPAVVKGRSRAAYFALATFLVTCVALNPTQLGFVMAVVIGWVAYAVPRPAPSHAPHDGPQARPLRALRLAGASIVGLAFAATVAATVAYSSARAAIGAGDMQRAEEALELATILDPSLAFYARQLGTVRLVSGDPARAVPALARATALNPSDDLAWRVLGLAAEGSGDPSGAKDALDRAVEVQRSDATNLLLLASILREDADQLARTATLSEIVQALPAVVGAQGWKTFAAPDSTARLVLMAQDRWARGLPSLEPRSLQPLLLGVWVGLPDDELDLEPARVSPSLRDAYVAVMRCDPRATATLRATSDADRRQPIYWALASRLARLEGRDATTFDRAYRLMTGLSLTGGGSSPLNPLNTNVGRGASPDIWGYRRQPIDWPDLGGNLPSPAGGFVRWVGDPSAAVREAGLEDVLQNCPTE